MDEKDLWFGIFESRQIRQKNINEILDRLASKKNSANKHLEDRFSNICREMLMDESQIHSLWLDISEKIEKVKILNDLKIQFTTRKSINYPKRLIKFRRKEAPYLLYYKGNLDILKRKSIAFSGSRKASKSSLEKTYKIAKALSDAGYNIVSGFAKGVDTAAHLGALEGRGTTTVVLSNGILKFEDSNLREKIKEQKNIRNDKMLVISEYPMNMPWFAHNAMNRNWTIASLAEKVFIIESEMDGGTFAMGELCLKQKKPLYVQSFNDKEKLPKGNFYLLKNGGKSLEIYLKYLMNRTIDRKTILNEMNIADYGTTL
ncbi:MAG TPA: DNA-processing protein DprA [Candidatus Limnocylindrales bacterium]|nr:DNA-processing protein DprA [Candidatus Limnocylindrales bacterium]